MQFKMEDFQKLVQLAVTEQVAEDDQRANRWVELALLAPNYFGPNCFMPGHKEREDMRQAILDSFKCPEAPERSDKSDSANAIRAKRKHASTFTSVAVTRMVKYYEDAMGEKTEKQVTQALPDWCANAIKQLVGHGEKSKPRVHGEAKAIASLVQHLTKLAGDAYKPAKVVAGKKAKSASKRASPVVTQAANDGNNLTTLINGIVKAA